MSQVNHLTGDIMRVYLRKLSMFSHSWIQLRFYTEVFFTHVSRWSFFAKLKMSTDFPSSSLNTNKVGFEPSTPLKKENKKTPPSSDDNAMQHSGLITYTKSRKIFVSRKRKQLEKVGTWNLLWVNHKMFSYFSSEIKAFFFFEKWHDLLIKR